MEYMILSLGLGVATVVAAIVAYNRGKEYSALLDAFEEFHHITRTLSQDEVQQNFLKFVSDSREQAFEYIEETHGQLKAIVDSMVETVAHIHTKKNISGTDKMFLATYYSLVDLLPDSDDQDTI